MRKALLFKDGNEIILSAQQVLDNYETYKYEEFVDPEYEFRVNFIKDCKGHTGPYFRFYLSKEDYSKLSTEKKTKYDILANQRHFQEGPWHRYWEDKFKQYGNIEYYIKAKNERKYKRADFFYLNGKTCVEFQHSYIANDFEERNEFYDKEGLNIVWLYDLTMVSVKENNEGYFEILENNAKGFFKVSENQQNLSDYPVFIQVKGGTIYRVKELLRKEIDNKLKSTIRFFKNDGIYTEDEFVKGVIESNTSFKSKKFKEKGLSSIYDLWDKSYSMIIITDGEKEIKITGTKDGGIFSDLNFGNILFNYVDWLGNSNLFLDRNGKNYRMKKSESNEKKWKLLKAYYRKI